MVRQARSRPGRAGDQAIRQEKYEMICVCQPAIGCRHPLLNGQSADAVRWLSALRSAPERVAINIFALKCRTPGHSIESLGLDGHMRVMMMFSFHMRFLPKAGKLLNRR